MPAPEHAAAPAPIRLENTPVSGASLEVSGLRVTYGHVNAVRGIDLHVDAGEAVALLGPNGAGKTSTLRAISRLISAEGDIHFDGRSTARRRPEDLARAGLIHVPEGRRLFPNLTVHENLLVGRTATRARPDGIGTDDVYDLFPALAPLRRRAGWALSGGEQQMVAIGRALMGNPRMLLLDEPSLGLAPVVVQAVFGALAGLVGLVPMLLVEQNTVAALGLCQRAYVLSGGEVVLSGASAELGDRHALLDSYLR